MALILIGTFVAGLIVGGVVIYIAWGFWAKRLLDSLENPMHPTQTIGFFRGVARRILRT